VVLLLGARLNWILHFGLPPRWNPQVKIIHVDISPEEIGNNVKCELPLVGDVRGVVSQLLEVIKNSSAGIDCKNWKLELQKKYGF